MTRSEKIDELWNAYWEIGDAIYSLEQAGMSGVARNLRGEREDIMDEIDRLETKK